MNYSDSIEKHRFLNSNNLTGFLILEAYHISYFKLITALILTTHHFSFKSLIAYYSRKSLILAPRPLKFIHKNKHFNNFVLPINIP